MSSSCCGGPPKSETAKIPMTAGQQTPEVATEKTVVKSNKSECCNDKPTKNEKHGCGC